MYISGEGSKIEEEVIMDSYIKLLTWGREVSKIGEKGRRTLWTAPFDSSAT
jgi:hypothetical protein